VPVLDNAKHELFAQGVASGLSATEAYTRAGYDGDRTAASRLSSNVNVKARIEELLGNAAEQVEITQAMVLRELAKIGFADIRKAVQWGGGVAVTHADSGEVTIANGVSLVDSVEIDDDTAAAISEVAQTKEGIRIKFHDKKGALVDIGKHLGMFKEDKQAAPAVTVIIQGNDAAIL
jgi:phage terminase small subunit